MSRCTAPSTWAATAWRCSILRWNAATSTVLSLESDLRHAAERGELLLRFQPIVKPATKELVGCEALVRWRIRRKASLHPTPSSGRRNRPGRSSASTAGYWARPARRRRGCARSSPELRIAINLSTRDLCESDLPGRGRRSVAPTRHPAERAEDRDHRNRLARGQRAAGSAQPLRVGRRVRSRSTTSALGTARCRNLKRLPITALKIALSDNWIARGRIGGGASANAGNFYNYTRLISTLIRSPFNFSINGQHCTFLHAAIFLVCS